MGLNHRKFCTTAYDDQMTPTFGEWMKGSESGGGDGGAVDESAKN